MFLATNPYRPYIKILYYHPTLERFWYAYSKDSWFAMAPSGGTQSKGYSDIQKREVDYTTYSEIGEQAAHARVRAHQRPPKLLARLEKIRKLK